MQLPGRQSVLGGESLEAQPAAPIPLHPLRSLRLALLRLPAHHLRSSPQVAPAYRTPRSSLVYRATVGSWPSVTNRTQFRAPLLRLYFQFRRNDRKPGRLSPLPHQFAYFDSRASTPSRSTMTRVSERIVFMALSCPNHRTERCGRPKAFELGD